MGIILPAQLIGRVLGRGGEEERRGGSGRGGGKDLGEWMGM